MLDLKNGTNVANAQKRKFTIFDGWTANRSREIKFLFPVGVFLLPPAQIGLTNIKIKSTMNKKQCIIINSNMHYATNSNLAFL